ncbi:MAG: hypothetical protein K2L56_01945 [Prevotella sp.]|nr:hypothetical protein [Prevotella sp.]
MAKKVYQKPEITVVELEIESLLASFSGGDSSGMHTTPKDDEPVTGGDADSKHNSGNLWGAWDE